MVQEVSSSFLAIRIRLDYQWRVWIFAYN